MSSSNTKRTYLRVKRRRSAPMAASLRTSFGSTTNNKGSDNNNLVSSLNSLSVSASITSTGSSRTASQAPAGRRQAVLWKRVDFADDSSPEVQFVNALLQEEEDEAEQPKKRRRRLTLLPAIQEKQQPKDSSKPKTKQFTNYKVLDPLQRLVDDHLAQVFTSSVSTAQHYEFVTTDSRLADQATSKWLAWRTEQGNLLHACALWDDAETARSICMHPPNLDMLDAMDDEGRTPYELAELSGHDSVVQVLEAFGASADDDNNSYVFDVYCMEEAEDVAMMNTDAAITGSTSWLEVEGGYWDSQGQQLVLSPSAAVTPDAGDERYSNDSNDEDWSGNDYPDEEEEHNDSSDDDEVDASFRQRPMIGVVNDIHENGDYDSAYGLGSEPEYDKEI